MTKSSRIELHVKASNCQSANMASIWAGFIAKWLPFLVCLMIYTCYLDVDVRSAT